MLEQNYAGNIFLLPNLAEAVVITTNGVTKKDGTAVMGAGIAKYARDHFPGIDATLGKSLASYGNHACYLGRRDWAGTPPKGAADAVHILAFPTKHDWRDKSDLNLIKRSAEELVQLVDTLKIIKIYLPKPGCNLGGLDYKSQVRPVLQNTLDNRFVVCLDGETFAELHAGKGARSHEEA